MTTDEGPHGWWHHLSGGIAAIFRLARLPWAIRFASGLYAAFWAIYTATVAVLFLRAVLVDKVNWMMAGRIAPSIAWPVLALIAGLLVAPRLIAIIESRGFSVFGVKVDSPSHSSGEPL